jgi:hypothetical protein
MTNQNKLRDSLVGMWVLVNYGEGYDTGQMVLP